MKNSTLTDVVVFLVFFLSVHLSKKRLKADNVLSSLSFIKKFVGQKLGLRFANITFFGLDIL